MNKWWMIWRQALQEVAGDEACGTCMVTKGEQSFRVVSLRKLLPCELLGFPVQDHDLKPRVRKRNVSGSIAMRRAGRK